jgi:hypothetical protein
MITGIDAKTRHVALIASLTMGPSPDGFYTVGGAVGDALIERGWAYVRSSDGRVVLSDAGIAFGRDLIHDGRADRRYPGTSPKVTPNPYLPAGNRSLGWLGFL